MNEQQVIKVAGIIGMVLVSNSFHEGGHAVVAWWCGDKRPEIRARMTLNPIKHASLLLTVIVPLISWALIGAAFGGAKPVMVDAERVGPRKMALVALAGPFGNALFGAIAIVVTAFLLHKGVIDDIDWVSSSTFEIMKQGIFYSAFLAVTNLIPLPPADGSRILGAVMPDAMRRVYFALAPITAIGFIVLVFWFTGQLHAWFPAVPKGHREWIAQMSDHLHDWIFLVQRRLFGG